MRPSGRLSIPDAPRSIQKGVPLKHLLGREAVDCLAHNLRVVRPTFDAASFREAALNGLEDLEFMPRGRHVAAALRQFLPAKFADAVHILVESFTPPRTDAEEFGLAEFFYLPHSFFIAEYGVDPSDNGGEDPFDISMVALRELTMRFTSEFAIRPFLTRDLNRTLSQVMRWTTDPNPHVRRLCSEGTRPRLPWGKRIPALVEDPSPTVPILEQLNRDPSLYVRRSVANHLGDIAKDHPDFVIEICLRWLEEDPSPETKWLVRHAVRGLAKKGHPAALALRASAR